MITEKEALEKTAKMWKWLANNPAKDKLSYFKEFETTQFITNLCYCCQYTDEQGQKQDTNLDVLTPKLLCSKFCPLKEHWPTTCVTYNTDYKLWTNAKGDLKVRSHNARQIQRAAEKALKKLG